MFITFEGIEGSGKSTQAKLLYEYIIRKKNIPCILTREPGGTHIGKKIREILLKTENRSISPQTELFLYEADRAQHFEEVIRPNLKRGVWVISDRCMDATTVYQGFGRGLDIEMIRILNQISTDNTIPDLTFILDCPPDIGLMRARLRIEGNPSEEGFSRFEREEIGFHAKVREGYLQLSRTHERFKVLDGTLEPPVIHEQIVRIVQARLEHLGL